MVLDSVETFSRDLMTKMEIPGIQIALTDREGLIGALNLGYSNLDARIPVAETTLFEFGSIGKSFTAICLLQLAAEGLVDLKAPLADQLPWFSVQSEYEPITIHHLLSHSSGLISGTDFTPEQRYEVWSLRNTDTMWAPGSRFHYSNVGYKTLGLLIEHVTGRPYGDVVRDRIFDPLGMRNAATAITNDLRPRLAIGYQAYFDDRPRVFGHGVVPAPWLETDSGDGCLSASASDLAIYLRMLLNRGAYPGGCILTEDQFATMTTPCIAMDSNGVRAYGYGIAVPQSQPPGPFGHSGGMVGYISDMRADATTGFGAIAFTNSMNGVARITQYALELLAAAQSGEPLPDPTPATIDGFRGIAGTYRGRTESIELSEGDGGDFTLHREGVALRLVKTPYLDGDLVDDRPGQALFPYKPIRDEHDSVVSIVHGSDMWVAEGQELPAETDPRLARLAGHYRSNNPWQSNFRLVARGPHLFRIQANGEEEQLGQIDDAWTGESDEDGPERFWIDVEIDGIVARVRDQLGSTWERSFAP